MAEPTSTTKSETWVEEALFDLGSHYVTTITDGEDRVEGRGSTSEQSQEVASSKWDKIDD